jgi:hypothetical protein
MADRVSSRRMVANGFFLTVHTLILGMLGFAYDRPASEKAAVYVLGLLGLFLAVTWFFAIRSYRRLNRAKFNVINEMEQHLSTQYFTREWAELTRTTESDLELSSLRQRWIMFKDRYTTMTNVESLVPVVFALIYLLIALGAIFGIMV